MAANITGGVAYSLLISIKYIDYLIDYYATFRRILFQVEKRAIVYFVHVPLPKMLVT